MKMIYFGVVTLSLISNCVQCDKKETSKKIKESLPSFRKRIEEIALESSVTEDNDSKSNIVSLLVKNVKEIFTEAEEPTIILDPDLNTISDNETSTEYLNYTSTIESTISEQENIVVDKNIEIKAIYTEPKKSIFNKSFIYVESFNDTDVFKKQLNPSKNLLILKSQQELKNTEAFSAENSMMLNISLRGKDNGIPGRSCIACNNIFSEECSHPKNKLITSMICPSEEDFCYSQHTPFGIVNRGCFNIYKNLTTYVCSCNLCNYISISEMPHIFSSKRDWIENVIELSRTKSFRKSIFKDMSCLTCEVNTTTKSFINNTSCLEGNIRTLPIQECAENEICGVKAIRSAGYIWRGCLTNPLYNYWWTLCDTDLCNYDDLVSIFEEPV